MRITTETTHRIARRGPEFVKPKRGNLRVVNYTIINDAIRKGAIALFSCASLIACADTSKASETESSSIQKQENNTNTKSVPASKPRFRAPGMGKDYEWGKDHIFVKLSSAETGGTLTLIQDNLKPGFDLGMHFHRTHTEIFYILEGEVEFSTDKTLFTAKAGSVVYLPAGTPHAAKSSTGGRMLMFYAPGGFDEMLAAIENASWLQRINPMARARRDEKYDFIKGTENVPVAANSPAPVFVAGGSNSIKLSYADTNGLAKVTEETLKPGLKRVSSLPLNQAEILYVLDGELEFSIEGQTQVARTGAIMYLPAGVQATVKSSVGAIFLTYRTPGVE